MARSGAGWGPSRCTGALLLACTLLLALTGGGGAIRAPGLPAAAVYRAHTDGSGSSGSSGSAFVDTESWLGAEYTPAAAPANGLWWAWFDLLLPGIRRELPAAARVLRLTTLRVFLHSMVFASNGTKLVGDMRTFLDVAAESNISVGLVFFGDCFNRNGASVTVPCTPVKGLHNGCWMTSPQDAERARGVEAFKPYVTDIVTAFRDDPRVRWWEVFNEPRLSSPFSAELRDAAYRWAKGVGPAAPVLSCWDDSNDTDVVDHHDYGTAFKSEWAGKVYQDPAKGAVVTEAGSRWFQPEPIGAVNTGQVDQGCPLTVINFLQQLRVLKRAGKVSFVPGAMVCWELMVGNSNTRWHWGTAVGSREPAIPWDAWMFPDGTPVSHTEAAAFRRYVTGHDEFVAFQDFLPDAVADGDVYQSVGAGEAYVLPAGSAHSLAAVGVGVKVGGGGPTSSSGSSGSAGSETTATTTTSSSGENDGSDDGRAGARPAAHAGAKPLQGAAAAAAALPANATVGDALVELSLWADGNGDGVVSVALRAGAFWPAPAPPPTPPPPPQPGPPPSCARASTFNNTDVPGTDGYRDFALGANGTDPAAACEAACCGWAPCRSWIYRPLSPGERDNNCSYDAGDRVCCWLKREDGSRHVGRAGATAGTVTKLPAPPAPIGPPLPGVYAGYEVRLDAAARRLTLTKHVAPGSSRELGRFDLGTIENGLVADAWNLLRVLMVGGEVTVWFNPMLPETGFVGNISDAERVPRPLPPRIRAADPDSAPPGAVVVSAGGRDTRVDYVSALPPSVV